MKIHPVGAELFHADRHDEVNSHYWQILRKRLKLVSVIVSKWNSQINLVDEIPTDPKAYKVMTAGTRKLPLAYNCLMNGL